MTPDQPTGMNELRPILLAVRDWGEGLAKQQFDDDPLPGMSPTDAEAAIQQIVERCLGPDEPGIPMESVQPDGSQMMQIDPGNRVRAEIRHNFQQAGLLRGDET